ncbi:hypothetical protein KIN20_013564 [Parelaphostrongylus tenuis]|uniref:Uncharacterized protein n=1 Tax=Parelaphostrongylus tenuis TaxID=148309 RepID=A0AAD5QL44_PARTN|nr:hypothetical protein KIN20_013564 [Parelaphostrongylus tenuis]
MELCLLVFLFFMASPTFACGIMPPGQARMLAFTVSGFSLPVNMVWTSQETEARQFPGISRSSTEAQAFVQRLTIQAIFDVLEDQGRRAGLFPAVIPGILDQLTVRSNYTALQCDKIHANPMDKADLPLMADMKGNCIMIGNTVSSICTKAAG